MEELGSQAYDIPRTINSVAAACECPLGLCHEKSYTRASADPLYLDAVPRFGLRSIPPLCLHLHLRRYRTRSFHGPHLVIIMAPSCSVSPASLATLWLTLAALAAGAQPPHEEVQHQALRPTPTPTLQDPAAPAAWHSDGSRCDSFEVGLAHARLCDAAAGQDNEDEDGGRAGLEVQQPLRSLVKRQDPPGGQSLTVIVIMMSTNSDLRACLLASCGRQPPRRVAPTSPRTRQTEASP